MVFLNRPECLNALNLEMAGRFKQVLQRFAADPATEAIVIAGRHLAP